MNFLQKSIELLRNLIKINSENPNSSELDVQKFLQNFLKNIGFEIYLVPYKKERNNLIALFPPLSQSIKKNLTYIAFSGGR
ncbi:MAG: hypothetical protein ACTSRZ_14730 [Promethearchaeota archaeon]